MRYSIKGLKLNINFKVDDWKGSKANGNVEINLDGIECELSSEEMKEALKFYETTIKKLLKEVEKN